MTRIDLEGDECGRYVKLTRRRESEYIDVQLLLPDDQPLHHVHRADNAEQLRIAVDVQAALDGHHRSKDVIRAYLAEIERLAYGCWTRR